MIGPGETLKQALARVERQIIALTLFQHGGNRAATAAALGIGREGLYRACIRLGLEPHHRKKSLAARRVLDQMR